MNTLEPDFVEAEEALESLNFVLRHPEVPSSLAEEMERIRLIYVRGSESTKYKILTELIDIEFTGTRPLLLEVLMNDESPLLRHEAAFGLGIFKKESDREALIEAMLHDSHEMVRHEAAIALAEIGDEECLPALKKASQDESVAVSSSARYAIQNIYLEAYAHSGVANV